MSWDIRQRIFIDLAQWGAGHLLDFEASTARDRSGSFQIHLADCFLLQVCFVDRSVSNTALVSLPSGYQIVVAGKKLTSSAPAGDVLFNASGFGAFTDGSITGYEAVLDANTAEFSAALGSASEIDIQLDVEIQNGANTRRITLPIACKGLPQSYAGEGSPTPAEPVYPSPSAIRTTDDMADGIVLTKGPGGELVITVDGIERGSI